MTEYQSELLGQVTEFVLHGDDYSRAGFVKRFLESAGVRGRDLQRAAFEKLVALEVMDVDEHLDLDRNDIATEFADSVLEEARHTDQAQLLADRDRDDLTALLTITIDDADTRDRDDALSIETPEPGVYRVGIHITDAGALIGAGSVLDVEADRRMSSLYLPEQTISMLPPAVSAGSGSLNPGEARAAVSVVVDMTETGASNQLEGSEFRDTQRSRAVVRRDRLRHTRFLPPTPR